MKAEKMRENIQEVLGPRCAGAYGDMGNGSIQVLKATVQIRISDFFSKVVETLGFQL